MRSLTCLLRGVLIMQTKCLRGSSLARYLKMSRKGYPIGLAFLVALCVTAFLSGFFNTLSDRLGLPPMLTIKDIQERIIEIATNMSEELGSWLGNVVADFILRNPQLYLPAAALVALATLLGLVRKR